MNDQLRELFEAFIRPPSEPMLTGLPEADAHNRLLYEELTTKRNANIALAVECFGERTCSCCGFAVASGPQTRALLNEWLPRINAVLEAMAPARAQAPFSIMVNGREHPAIMATTATYYDVVTAAGHTGEPSVTWRVRGGTKGGILAKGEHVTLEDGMVFNVSHTGNA